MLRAIREISPRWVVGENVRGLTNWNGGLVFDEVQADLEAIGYEVLPFLLPACAVNAPHRRDRIWFIAYSENTRLTGWNRLEGNDDRLCERRAVYTTGGGSNAGNEIIANTASDRREWEWQRTTFEKGLQQRPKSTRELERGFEGLCGSRPTADTDSQRHEERQSAAVTDRTERQYREADFAGKPGGWDNFPTQPPVRGRNDGIPAGLDGITVSKHRNESIKAYGNAIVPQVAYQIFKAIEQYEQQ